MARKPKPKIKKKLERIFSRRATEKLERRGMHLYRGYRFTHHDSPPVIEASYLFQSCTMWLPRSFLWACKDTISLCEYIDALTAKDELKKRYWEQEKALAHSHIFRNPPADIETIRISPYRLALILRGEDPLEVSINSKIHLDLSDYDDTESQGIFRKIIPEIEAELLSDKFIQATVEAVKDLVKAGYPVLYSTKPLDDKPYRFEFKNDWRNTNLNLYDAQRRMDLEDRLEIPIEIVNPGPPPGDAPADAEGETVIRTVDLASHQETYSLITRNGDTPYFIRRMLRQETVVWVGTSYDLNGPWHQTYVDEPRMAVLRLALATPSSAPV